MMDSVTCSRENCRGRNPPNVRDVWRLSNGQLHSVNGKVAKIVYGPDGDIKVREMWYRKGEKHRSDDLPAEIGYYTSGCIRYKTWYQGGQYCRKNHDPVQVWYENNEKGNVSSELWYNGNHGYRDKSKYLKSLEKE